MLKSFVAQRPFALFDPANAEHRAYFYHYLKNSSWGNCPYQWFITDDSVDVVYYINKLMVSYYMNNEFVKKVVAKKPRSAVSKKVVQIATQTILKKVQKQAQNG
jgi:hypothetical protein